MKLKANLPRGNGDRDGDNRLEKMLHGRKDKHGKELRRKSSGETEVD
jgi:hypothetical protein